MTLHASLFIFQHWVRKVPQSMATNGKDDLWLHLPNMHYLQILKRLSILLAPRSANKKLSPICLKRITIIKSCVVFIILLTGCASEAHRVYFTYWANERKSSLVLSGCFQVPPWHARFPSRKPLQGYWGHEQCLHGLLASMQAPKIPAIQHDTSQVWEVGSMNKPS